MFVGEIRAYTSEAPFRCTSLGWAPALIPKHWTRLERLVEDKQSSLLRTLVIYGYKSFITLAPGVNAIKLFTAVIY
jgi:hypothetical protein